ncbi:ATP-binding protein [Aestuariibacter salexigens]|uniref:ATP-binding protein n=1 Tax=Aestuariibacter salexigens TaxID=226010 RepID=UPI001F0A559A|nr:ATP-binding protein [Aestuariibacter salexigens]
MALLVLTLFIPAMYFTLDRAFTNSLLQAKLSELRTMSLSIIAEIELDGDMVDMPELLFDDQLNIPGSGYYAFIQKDDEIVWNSWSAIELPAFQSFPLPDVGKEMFVDTYGENQEYLLYAYSAEFATDKGYKRIGFLVLHERFFIEKERQAFLRTLQRWLAVISVVLLALLMLTLRTTLQPLNRLRQEIGLAEQGEIGRIEHQFPPELEGLKHSINHLLDTESQQRERYKNSLGDLAHSLKTPVAVISGHHDLPHSVREPLTQIDNIIQRQLKRASAATGGWHHAVDIAPVVTKLSAAMLKVHRNKALEIIETVEDMAMFRGDETDLMEILGNVVDNACKACQRKVEIRVWTTHSWLNMQIDDDGPGIAESLRKKMLTRGTRLDAYEDGQGIGMAVVSDLVSIYQGQLDIERAELGGASIILRFPQLLT